MKKTSKVLSILLAVLMVMSCIPFSAMAAIPAGTTTLQQFVQQDSLANLADWLVNALDARKTYFADTVLTFVDAFVEPINEKVPDGTNLFGGSVSTAKKATYLMDYLDALLQEKNLNESLGEDVTKIVNSLPGLTLNLNSVNGILSTLDSVDGIKFIAGGDIANLNLSNVTGLSRSKTGDLQIIYKLISFIKDNLGIIKKFVNGKLDLGIVGSVAKDVEDKANGVCADLPYILTNLVYQKILKLDGELKDSAVYKDWNVDELLVAKLFTLLKKDKSMPTKEEVDAALNVTVYSLFTTYGDRLYESYLVEWLNDTLPSTLDSISAGNDLSKLFKEGKDIVFTKDDYKFADKDSFLGEFNNVFVTVVKKITTDAGFAALNLEMGDNSKLNANFEKVVRYVLPMMASVDTGEFDFSEYTAEYIADKSISELGAQIVKTFYQSWFGLVSGSDDMKIVANIKTMPELAASAIYFALTKKFPDMFTGPYDFKADFDSKMFVDTTDYAFKELGETAWSEVMLTMAADAAIFGMNANMDNDMFTDYTVTDSTTYNDIFNYIAKWAVKMVKGMPAVADNLTDTYIDTYSGINALNVLLNELIDWSFVSNCESGSFKFDLRDLAFNEILGNVYDFDLAGVLAIFAKNSNADNIFNKNTVPMLVSFVDNLLDALFYHTGSDKAFELASDCYHEGFSGKACSVCGLYKTTTVTKLNKLSHDFEEKSLEYADCQHGGKTRKTCKLCGDIEYDYPAQKPHNYVAVENPVVIDGHLWIVERCTMCKAINEKNKVDLGPVDEDEVVAIEVTTPPTNLRYSFDSDSALDIEGLVVTATYSSGSQEVIDNADLEFSALDTSVEGEQTITVTYEECEATFVVTVVKESAHTHDFTIATDAKGVMACSCGATTCKAGDVNGDGEILASDARLALRYSVKLETLTGISLLAANVDNSMDGNNGVSASDARLILRASVKLEDPTAWAACVLEK